MNTFPESKLDLLDALHNAEILGRTHLPKTGAITSSGTYYEENQEEEDLINTFGYIAPPGVEPYMLF